MVSLLGRIVNEDPEPVTAIKPVTPYLVWQALRQSLRKDKEDRTQTARELCANLREAQDEVRAGVLLVDARTVPKAAEQDPVSAAPFRQVRSMIAAGVLALFVGVVGTWFLKPAPETNDPPLRKFQWSVEGLNRPVISPDGTRLAYVAENRLWIRDLDSATPRLVPDTEGAARPFWSPGSDFVGYQTGVAATGESLWRVPAEGGAATPIFTRPAGAFINDAAWGEEGRIVFAGGPALPKLYSVSANGGEPQLFLEPDSTDLFFGSPHFLPGGPTLLFVLAQQGDPAAVAKVAERYPDGRDAGFIAQVRARGIVSFVIAAYAENGARRVLDLPGDFLDDPVLAPSGHLLYRHIPPSRRTSLWAVAFDPETLTVTGEPFLVAPNSEGAAVSTDGTLVYATSGDTGGVQRLVWVDRSGRVTDVIGSTPPGSGYFWSPALSPDDTKVAVAALPGGSIWIYDIERGARTEQTPETLIGAIQPVWSASGREIVVAGRQGTETGSDFFRIAVNGEGSPLPILVEPLHQFGLTLSRDQSFGVYHQITGGQRDLWSVSIPSVGATGAPAPEPVQFMKTPDNEARPDLSPDGRYVAYQAQPDGSGLSEGWEVFVQRFPDGGEHTQVSVAGGVHPKWSARGDELFFVQPDANALIVASVRTQPGFQVDTPEMVFVGDQVGATLFSPRGPQGTPYETMYDVSSDGQRFVVVQPAAEAPTPTITVVENWAREFEKP